MVLRSLLFLLLLVQISSSSNSRAYDIVMECILNENGVGCGKVQNDSGTLTCAPAFVLVLHRGEKENYKVYSSLRVENRQWMDNVTALGYKMKTDKPLCISKCAPGFVQPVSSNTRVNYNGTVFDGLPPASIADRSAGYTQGVLKCADPKDVLIATLFWRGANRGRFEKDFAQPFFGALKCDANSGWTQDGVVVKSLQSPETTLDLYVQANCYNPCDAPILTIREDICKGSCDEKPTYNNQTRMLTCPKGYRVVANGKALLTPLVCSAGESLTPDFLANETDTVEASCVSIPCFEYSPLNAGKNLTDKLKNGSTENAGPVKCDAPEKMFYERGDNAWSEVDQLKCKPNGEWEGADPSDPAKKIVFSGSSFPQPRVICNLTSPNVVVEPKTPINCIDTREPVVPSGKPVVPRAVPTMKQTDGGLSTLVTVAIVIGATVIILGIVGVILYCCTRRRRDVSQHGSRTYSSISQSSEGNVFKTGNML